MPSLTPVLSRSVREAIHPTDAIARHILCGSYQTGRPNGHLNGSTWFMNGMPLSAGYTQGANDGYVGGCRQCSSGRHDGMLKSHIVEEPLDRGALRVGTT